MGLVLRTLSAQFRMKFLLEVPRTRDGARPGRSS